MLTQKWHLLIGDISATVYLDTENNVKGYDFWGPVRRTKVVTRFFDIVAGKIDAKVFDNFPC